MNNNIEFEKSLLGIKAIVKGAWQDSFLNLIIEKSVSELELNVGKGWKGENVAFLKFLPNLKSLIIIDFNIKSITAIHGLNELLKLQLTTYSKTPVNFNAFPNLAECDFEWINGSDSLFECNKLIALGLNKYDKISSRPFSNLIYLTRLTILNSKIENLEGLSKLENLNYLSIANLKNLLSLKGIENLRQLEYLEIQRCKKIFSIPEVFMLNKLKRLLLLDLGDIESINGIQNLANLKDFLFYESTNIIDGDISPVLKLKNLSTISFQNRKHYSHKREDFGRRYA